MLDIIAKPLDDGRFITINPFPEPDDASARLYLYPYVESDQDPMPCELVKNGADDTLVCNTKQVNICDSRDKSSRKCTAVYLDRSMQHTFLCQDNSFGHDNSNIAWFVPDSDHFSCLSRKKVNAYYGNPCKNDSDCGPNATCDGNLYAHNQDNPNCCMPLKIEKPGRCRDHEWSL